MWVQNNIEQYCKKANIIFIAPISNENEHFYRDTEFYQCPHAEAHFVVLCEYQPQARITLWTGYKSFAHLSMLIHSPMMKFVLYKVIVLIVTKELPGTTSFVIEDICDYIAVLFKNKQI